MFPSGIYHAVPDGQTTWHGLACLAVQSALDAGIALKASPLAIKPILAVEYPLPAPRPMNSCMSTDKLRKVFLLNGGKSQLDLLNRVWIDDVRIYVAGLARDKLI